MPAGRDKAQQPRAVENLQTATRVVPAGFHADIRRELKTVLESPEFRTSHRGKMLLQYVVDHAIDGAVSKLKERTIGVELFHRDPLYDTGQDAIVRVAANDLRKRLTAHYLQQESEGLRSTIKIQLAPGSYVPEFETNSSPGTPEFSTPPLVQKGNLSGIAHPIERKPGRQFLVRWAMVLALAAACVFLALENQRLRSDAAHQGGLTMLPWSQIALPGEHTTLVASDSNFSLFKMLVQEDRPLPAYINQHWLGELGAALPSLPGLTRIPITSIADVSLAASMGSVLQSGNSGIEVRSGRAMQVEDFKSHRPIILVGSAFANPWVALVNGRLNFSIEYNPSLKKQVCRNASPRPGEAPVYIGTAATPMPGTAYATLSLVRNLSGNSFVLVVAGTNMEGTLAAGELVTDIPRLTGELKKRGIDPARKVEQLEILLRLDHLGTQTSRSEIIAHRVRL